METRTLRATLHSGTTAAGNGTAATNPTGGGLILGTLTGSGAITVNVVVEISAAGSVWVPLRAPERINGAGSVPVQIYYSTTAAQVRLRVVDITGTLSVGLYAVGPAISTDLEPSPDGTIAMPAPSYRIRPGMKGFRKIFSRLAALTNHASGYTFQDVISLEQDFDAIQLVIGTIQASGTIRSAHYFNVCSDEGLTDAQLDALPGWAFVDWTENDGNSVRAQFATFASGSSRPRYLVSQIKQRSSLARTDGKSLPLLVVRSHVYSDNLTPTVCGNGTTDVFSNVARTDGRTHKTRRAIGNGMTTFSGGADTTQTPLMGIIYYARGRVVNIAKFGDSITQDRNSPMGDGAVRDEVMRRSSKSRVAYELADFSWSGLQSANFHNIAMDAVDQFPINIAYYDAGSPNDIASGASLAAAQAALATAAPKHQEFVSKCTEKGVAPIISTIEPSTTAAIDWTLCDSARRDFNAQVVSLKDRGVLVCDSDAALSGEIVNGQMQPLAGTMLDGIHPNLVGRELIRQKLVVELDKISMDL